MSFCLNDGSALLALADEQLTQIRPSFGTSNTSPINAAQPTAPDANQFSYNAPASATQSRRSGGKTAFVAISVAALLVLLIGGIVAALILVPRGSGSGNVNTGTLKSPTPKDDDDELKEKIANLERKLQDRDKKSPTPTSATPDATATPTTRSSGTVTARVAQSNDGFLSLRTEPSVRTGTQLVRIPSGATVELNDCQTNYQTIDNRRGRWCMVTYDGEIGWVFDAWLIY